MPINITGTLTQAEYENLRFALIAQLEGKKPLPYFDNATNPYITIGIGFNIENQQMRNVVMNEMGLNSTQQASVNTAWNSSAMNNIRSMKPGTARDTALQNYLTQEAGQTFTLTNAQMRNVFNGQVNSFDTTAQGYTNVRTYSVERAVLCSLQYNCRYSPPHAKALLGPSLLKALNQYTDSAEARAEAWYQIRYNTDTQLKRRIIESELFGLYEDRRNVTVTEAKGVYRIYTLNKNNHMNTTWDTNNSNSYTLAAGDIAAINQVLTTLGSTFAVPSPLELQEQLDPAKISLINDLNTNSGTSINPDDYLSTDIMIDAGRITNLTVTANPNQNTTLTGSDRNDILLGEGGDDVLTGGLGNDVLLGGIGNDTLNGGENDDTLIGGKGQDNMLGGFGDDTFIIEGTDAAYDIYDGGDGTDTIQGADKSGSEDDTIRVQELTVNNSIEKIDGGKGTDTLAGTEENNIIDLTGVEELLNIEKIILLNGNDILRIDDKNIADLSGITIDGGDNEDRIEGTEQNDTMNLSSIIINLNP